MLDSLMPGIKDIIDGLSNFVRWYDTKKNEKHKLLWKNANLNRVYDWVVNYYQDLGDNLVSYSNSTSTRKYPLLVLPGWHSINSKNLIMNFENSRQDFEPSQAQKKFYNFFTDLKNIESFDLDVFNLQSIKEENGNINLDFELGKFSHSVMSQYILEDELILLMNENENYDRKYFSLRNSVASDLPGIMNFYKSNVTRIGLCTLLLLKKDNYNYIPIVKRRGKSSMINQNLFDPISSCIYEVATTPSADFELKHTLMREIYEELFGQVEVAKDIRKLNPYYFYERDGIKYLLELLSKGKAVFEVTGFCIDLIRLVPEITAVLVIQDEEYFQRYYKVSDVAKEHFEINEEFSPHSTLWEIPKNITDSAKYLKEDMISDPDGNKNKKGFDPLKWTLPGGYSFYQGITYAIENKLLI